MKLRRRALAEVVEVGKNQDKRLVKQDRALVGKLEEMLPAQAHKEVRMLAALLKKEASNKVGV